MCFLLLLLHEGENTLSFVDKEKEKAVIVRNRIRDLKRNKEGTPEWVKQSQGISNSQNKTQKKRLKKS